MSDQAPAQDTPTAEIDSKAPPTAPAETTTNVEAAPKDQTADQKADQPPPTTPEKAPVVPDKYDLKLPKGSTLDAAYLEKFQSEAKEKGLTQDQAQSLLERDSGIKSAFVAEQKTALKQAADHWYEASSKDSEIGGKHFKENVELAKRALNQFASEEMIKVLNETGLGNNPELIRTFMKVGKSLGDDRLVTTRNTPMSQPNMADRLYPTTKQKE